MKFISFTIYDAAKSTEIATLTDELFVDPPPGYNPLASYTCLAQPFPGLMPNTLVSITIAEAESAESLAAISYPLVFAGATFHSVPVLENPIGGAAIVEKKCSGRVQRRRKQNTLKT
jgi:hypothetical protein